MSLNQRRLGLNIVIDEKDQVSARQSKTGIACGGSAGFLLDTKSEIAIGFCRLFENRPRVVARVVIDNDDFVMLFGNCLRLNSLHSFSKQRGAVLCRNDDTKLRHHFPKLAGLESAESPLPQRAPSQLMKFPPGAPRDVIQHTTGVWSEEGMEYIGCDPQKQTCTTICCATNNYRKKNDLRKNYIERPAASTSQICRRGKENCES